MECQVFFVAYCTVQYLLGTAYRSCLVQSGYSLVTDCIPDSYGIPSKVLLCRAVEGHWKKLVPVYCQKSSRGNLTVERSTRSAETATTRQQTFLYSASQRLKEMYPSRGTEKNRNVMMFYDDNHTRTHVHMYTRSPTQTQSPMDDRREAHCTWCKLERHPSICTHTYGTPLLRELRSTFEATPF